MAKLQTNSACADPYGNCGAIPDASWTAQWIRFSPEMRDDYLKNIAHLGPLGLVQLECLIQGLLPPPPGWLSTCTCMAEYHPLWGASPCADCRRVCSMVRSNGRHIARSAGQGNLENSADCHSPGCNASKHTSDCCPWVGTLSH